MSEYEEKIVLSFLEQLKGEQKKMLYETLKILTSDKQMRKEN